MKRFCISLLVALGLLGSVRADLTITQKVEGAFGMNDLTIRIKGDKARIDASPQMTTIVDGKTGEVITLMKDKKQIMRISAEKGRALAEIARQFGMNTNPPDTKPRLVSTGKKETIGGYESEEYKVEGAAFPATYWITTKYPDYAAILRQLQTTQPSAWDLTKKGMPDYNDLPGIPMRITVNISGQGNVTSTITSIKQDPIGEDQFVIPDDFTETQMPEFPNLQRTAPKEKRP
jgi:hypothetical protein